MMLKTKSYVVLTPTSNPKYLYCHLSEVLHSAASQTLQTSVPGTAESTTRKPARFLYELPRSLPGTSHVVAIVMNSRKESTAFFGGASSVLGQSGRASLRK